MLPVALTCPLWWVARWATRVLTSLAVVAALALGAGPASAAAPTPSTTVAPSTSTAGSFVASCRPTAADGAVRPAATARAGGPAWSLDAQPAPPDARAAVAAGVLPVCAAGADRLPLVDGPLSKASRGPPGR